MSVENWTVAGEDESDDSQSVSSSKQHNPSVFALFSYFFSSRLLASSSVYIYKLWYMKAEKPKNNLNLDKTRL